MFLALTKGQKQITLEEILKSVAMLNYYLKKKLLEIFQWQAVNNREHYYFYSIWVHSSATAFPFSQEKLRGAQLT